MDTEILIDWIKHFDRKFLAQNHKIALIVDSFSSQLNVPGLMGIYIIIFSSKYNLNNTTKGSSCFIIVKSYIPYQSDLQVYQRYGLRKRIAKYHNTRCNDYVEES